jgi:hypothetical protein
MNYMEMLLLIQGRDEKIVSDKLNHVQTDKFMYVRVPTGEWEQKELTTILADGTRVEAPAFLPIVPTIIPEKKKHK